MKLLIDIDKNYYKIIKHEVENGNDYKPFEIIANGIPYKEKPQGECITCIHRDPEDKKCDCGGIERQGCPFPVSDDYFCKFYEKGGAE